MGRKVFVSYKYSDSQVANLPGDSFSTVRDYVTKLQELLGDENVNKGENDGEDLSEFSDEHIWTKLKEKIYDSTITIVMISKGMKDYGVAEQDQWIPWEIAYSLKELSRDGRYSKANAVLAVVLPDTLGSYNYFMEPIPGCNGTSYKTNTLFAVLRNNMFNRKKAVTTDCNGNVIHQGYFSYIYCVAWKNLINNLDFYIDIAVEIKNRGGEYDICKTV